MPLLLIASGLILAAATLALSWRARLRRERADPLAAAAEQISSSLRLTDAEESLLARLAEQSRVAPAALLLSGSALDRACAGLPAHDAALAISIRRKAGAPDAAVAAPTIA